MHGNNFEHNYLECICSSTDHVIKITLDKYDEEWHDENYGGIYVYVQLAQYRNIFKRIITAIKYVLNKEEDCGHWDCTILDINAVKKLHEISRDALNLHEYHQNKLNTKKEN